MRHVSPGAIALFVLSASALVPLAVRAQKPKEAPPAQIGPVTKIVDVTVTNLDVVAFDSKGNRVTGLKKEDFEVVEDGLQQNITNFYAVEAGRLTMIGDEVVPPPAPEAPGAPAPAPAVPTPKTRIVIFIDNVHITPFNRNRVLRNVEQFVRDYVKGDTEAMIVTWDRSLKIRRKFTNDGRDLADVLKQVEEYSAVGVTTDSERRELIQAIDDAKSCSEAEGRARQYALSLRNDLDFTIDAMKTTMNQLSGVEGRKILIHVSDGVPQSPAAEIWTYIMDRFRGGGDACSVQMANFEFDRTSGFIGVIGAANAAGVTIYALDAKGLSVDSGTTAENRTSKARLDNFTEQANLQAMLNLMAEETGGKAVLNKNDMTVALRDIEKDVSSYYSLGYRSIRSGVDRPHKVEVRCKRKGVDVRARRSYLEKSAETKITEAVTSALFFPRDENPMMAAMETGQAAPADRQNYTVPVTIRVPYSRITLLPEGTKVRGRLAFYFLVIDSQGKQSEMARQVAGIEMEATRQESVARKDFVYQVRLLMIPGGQKLSVAVKDDVSGTVSYLQKSVFVSALPPVEKPAPAPAAPAP